MGLANTVRTEEPDFRSNPRAATNRLEPKNILCGIDFSPCSIRAFDYATALARRFRATLFLQHSIEPLPEASAGLSDDVAAERAGAKLRRLAAVSRLLLPGTEMVVKHGDPGDCLMETVRQGRIDLTVVGAYSRRTALNGYAQSLGRITAAVLRQARCPVLVIGCPTRDFIAPDEIQPCNLQTILIAIDDPTISYEAIVRALSWAAVCGARIVLCHTYTADASEQMLTASADLLDAFVSAARREIGTTAAARVQVTRDSRVGNTSGHTLKMADDAHADLIVIPRNDPGDQRTSYSGSSIFTGVLNDGRLPVLIVPARRPEEAL
jgi:nucleotide-binding universal stress UspA family protein